MEPECGKKFVYNFFICLFHKNQFVINFDIKIEYLDMRICEKLDSAFIKKLTCEIIVRVIENICTYITNTKQLESQSCYIFKKQCWNIMYLE